MRVSLKQFAARLTVAVIVSLTFGQHAARASDQGNSSAGLVVYSDINYIEVEGEFSGLQVSLVPYYDGEKTHHKVLWRSAGPFLNSPLLLDATEEGKTLKVLVPQGDDLAGAWTLTLNGDFIDAVGPGGHLKYRLKKISIR